MKTTIPKTITDKKAAIDLITALTGQANILSIPVEFIRYTGSIDCALFLSQLLYWADKGSRRDGYIWKTYEQWEDEIFLSEYKVRKAANHLKSLGILETDIKKANGSPTVHYRIDLEKFSDSFLNFLQERKANNLGIQAEESEESLTYITTETTPYITTEGESFDETDSLSQGDNKFEEESTTIIVSEERENPARNLRKAGKAGAKPALLPEDFRPSEDTEYWAANTRPEISFNDALEKFVAHHRARGTELVDWQAELRKWVVNERPNPAKGEADLGFEHYLNRERAVTTVEDFFMENGVAGFNDAVEGLPELSQDTIRGCLRENVERGYLAKPDHDVYFSLSDYRNDPDYKELVDGQLEGLGITYTPPADDSKGQRQAA